MKTIVLALLFLGVFAPRQEKMLTKTGKVTFEASVPAFEEVKGSSQTVTCVLNPRTGDIQSQVLMKSFRFKIALMEEHFNENYIESDRYPKATFRGRIDKFDFATLSTTEKEYSIQGKLEMHGKTRDVSMPAKIRKTESGVEIISNFTVNTDDYGISIPSVVKNKVSKKVNISSEFLLK